MHSSTIKSLSNLRLTLRPTINLSILDTHLPQCQSFNQFNQILSQMILTGFIKDTFAASRLINFSTNSTLISFHYSLQIFNHLDHPNGFIWNTMMRSHLERNSPHEALYLYKRFLVNDNAFPDNYTYPILLRSCAARLSEFEGNEIHCHVVKLGFGTDVYARNTLMSFYAVCGNMVNARKVFDESAVLDLVSWNTILAGYVQMGDLKEAECVYSRMPERNTIASNSMIVLFGRMGCVVRARQVFDEIQRKDMISWSAMVSCYEQNDVYEEALVLFVDMNGNGVMVDEVVVVSAISACTNLSIVKTGMSMHALAVKIGIEGYVSLQNALIHLYSSCGKIMDARKLFSDGFLLDQISWNSMISGYLRCGSIEDAETLFYSLPDKDAVSWSAMISGYAQHERFSEALALFQEMQLHGIRPDVTALVSVISACTHLAALDLGRWVHAYISKNKL